MLSIAPLRVLIISLILPAFSVFAAVRAPSEVLDAVRAEFPGAAVSSIERERENGVLIYEINLAYKGKRIEAEFASDGSIGEIESVVTEDDVPASAMVELKQLVGPGRITRIEKHERRGIGRFNRFEPLDKPEVIYEAKYVRGSRRLSATVRYREPAKLPDTVREALKKDYDDAPVIDSQSHRENDQELFDVLVKAHNGLDHVLVTPDGKIVEVGRSVDLGGIPNVVRRAIALSGRGTRITGVQKVDRRANLHEGKYANLEKPLELYRARFIRDTTYADILVDGHGAIYHKSGWKPITEEDEDDGDEAESD